MKPVESSSTWSCEELGTWTGGQEGIGSFLTSCFGTVDCQLGMLQTLLHCPWPDLLWLEVAVDKQH
jgi:hypothetical protein